MGRQDRSASRRPLEPVESGSHRSETGVNDSKGMRAQFRVRRPMYTGWPPRGRRESRDVVVPRRKSPRTSTRERREGVGGPKVVLSLGAVLPTRSEIPARRVEEKVAKRRLLEKRDVERSEIT